MWFSAHTHIQTHTQKNIPKTIVSCHIDCIWWKMEWAMNELVLLSQLIIWWGFFCAESSTWNMDFILNLIEKWCFISLEFEFNWYGIDQNLTCCILFVFFSFLLLLRLLCVSNNGKESSNERCARLYLEHSFSSFYHCIQSIQPNHRLGTHYHCFEWTMTKTFVQKKKINNDDKNTKTIPIDSLSINFIK